LGWISITEGDVGDFEVNAVFNGDPLSASVSLQNGLMERDATYPREWGFWGFTTRSPRVSSDVIAHVIRDKTVI